MPKRATDALGEVAYFGVQARDGLVILTPASRAPMPCAPQENRLRTASLSEARSRLCQLLRQVEKGKEIVSTRRGKPNAMRIRRQTVEHPLGTIKFWMGPDTSRCEAWSMCERK